MLLNFQEVSKNPHAPEFDEIQVVFGCVFLHKLRRVLRFHALQYEKIRLRIDYLPYSGFCMLRLVLNIAQTLRALRRSKSGNEFRGKVSQFVARLKTIFCPFPAPNRFRH